MRNSSSVAGTLVLADGRSTLVTVLLALDTQIYFKLATASRMALGEYLPRRGSMKAAYLITAVSWPRDAVLEFDFVARTPADRPIVALGIARWPSGRTRVAVSGWGPSPLLAMDGGDSGGIEEAVRNALHESDDAWGSSRIPHGRRRGSRSTMSRPPKIAGYRGDGSRQSGHPGLTRPTTSQPNRSYFQRCSVSPVASLKISRSCCVKSDRQLPDLPFGRKLESPWPSSRLPLLVGV